jgi:hypothetical protein
MPLLNFKSQFVQPIREGRKRHTIRAERKIPVKVGDKLYLYSGLRQKGAFRILLDAVTCTRVENIVIGYGEARRFVLTVDGQVLDRSERERLARADGFKDFDKMMEFWRGRLPFKGNIIHWKP